MNPSRPFLPSRCPRPAPVPPPLPATLCVPSRRGIPEEEEEEEEVDEEVAEEEEVEVVGLRYRHSPGLRLPMPRVVWCRGHLMQFRELKSGA